MDSVLEEISVIVPVFKIEQYLERCIYSLLKQLKPVEIIAADDGSPDPSGEILDEFAFQNTNVVVCHKKNEGVTTARLIGVQLASGDYIGFCDGDDEVEPEMYERLYQNLIRYDADISHCGHKVIYTDGREAYFYNTGRLVKQDRAEGLKDLLTGSFEPGLWSKLFRKNLLHSLLHSGKMDTSIRINEDLLMNYYLFREAAGSVFEDFCPYIYMKREGSVSRQTLNIHHIEDPIKVKQQIFNESQGRPEEATAKKMLISKYLDIYNELIFDTKKKFVSEKTKLIAEMKTLLPEADLLGRKRKQFYRLALKAQHLYALIYRIYRMAG